MCNIDKFSTTIQMLNNELASQTWARKTWEQRVAEHKTIHANIKNLYTAYYRITPINVLSRRPVKVTTLCQSDGVCTDKNTMFVF